MSTRKKNIIALTLVTLFFVAVGASIYDSKSRIRAVLDSQPEMARQSAELSRRISLIGEPEPGQAPPGYSQYGPGPILVSCPVCKGKVSSAAEKCPHCGNPQ